MDEDRKFSGMCLERCPGCYILPEVKREITSVKGSNGLYRIVYRFSIIHSTECSFGTPPEQPSMAEAVRSWNLAVKLTK